MSIVCLRVCPTLLIAGTTKACLVLRVKVFCAMNEKKAASSCATLVRRACTHCRSSRWKSNCRTHVLLIPFAIVLVLYSVFFIVALLCT